MENISYKGIDSPTLEIYFQRFKAWYSISIESLSQAISPTGTFDDADDEGEAIDQQLYFYIPDELMHTGTTRQIMNYINSQT